MAAPEMAAGLRVGMAVAIDGLRMRLQIAVVPLIHSPAPLPGQGRARLFVGRTHRDDH